MRPLSDNQEVLRLSALLNAAKISPFVSGRTIGLKEPAKSDSNADVNSNNGKINGKTDVVEKDENVNDVSSVGKHRQNNNNRMKPITPKFRADVWRQVKADTTDEDDFSDTSSILNRTPASPLPLTDCKAISFRIAKSNAEKQRRAAVQSSVSRRVSDIDAELEQRLRQIRIESAEEAQRRLQEKRQQRENALLAAIEQMDETARHEREASEREITAMIEHNRKIIDRANKLKREEEKRELLELLEATKHVFMSRFEEYIKTIRVNDGDLRAAGRWDAYAEQQNTFYKRYEAFFKHLNSNVSDISVADVHTFEKLCDDVKQETAKAKEDIGAHRASKEEAAAVVAKAAEMQAQVQYTKIKRRDFAMISVSFYRNEERKLLQLLLKHRPKQLSHPHQRMQCPMMQSIIQRA